MYQKALTNLSKNGYNKQTYNCQFEVYLAFALLCASDIKKERSNDVAPVYGNEFRKTMHYIVDALREKGYNPYKQLYRYIIENDPSYITRHKKARELIQMLNKQDIYEYLKKKG